MTARSPLAVMLGAALATGCAGAGPVLRNPASPTAWRGYWLEQHRAELAQATTPGAARPLGHGRTVLLVPGMTIAAELFAPMAERLRRDGFNPVVYEDPALLTTGIEPAAKRLAARIEALVAETGEDRIDVVAQCVGGVTARYYVQRLGGDRRVDHLVTFVSPHHGSLPAVVAADVTGWQGMRDIRRDSALLQAVDAAPFPASVAFTSIYSCHDELLLPRDTAAVKGAVNVELCERRPIGHFDGFWDPGVYQRIVHGLLPAG